MLDFCEIDGGKCTKCGRQECDNCERRLCQPQHMRRAQRIRESKPAQKRSVCPHLLDPTDESVLVYGCGCASEKKNGFATQVWECAKHGRCVTFARGTHLADESIMRCVVCPDNPANHSPGGEERVAQLRD